MTEVQFRFVQYPPAARPPAFALVEWPADLDAQRGTGAGVARRRARMSEEFTVNDLANEVLWQREQVAIPRRT